MNQAPLSARPTFRGSTVFDHLSGAGAVLAASAELADGMFAALWQRDTGREARYERPEHHTFSLYVSGGEGYARQLPSGPLPSQGSGSLCMMPQGVTSDWTISGSVRLFHLYLSPGALDRAVAETLGTNPARVSLRDATYFRDPQLEGLIRGAVLPLRWDEPSERVALGHAGHALLALIAGRLTDSAPPQARGGLAPSALRRVKACVEAGLGGALSVEDLARVAGLSPFHFARAFKRSTGQTPAGFVLALRVERAKLLLAGGATPIAVAAACGFASQSHFGARFRAATGVSPGRYAKLATG